MRQGIGTRLIKEAHEQMRAAGLPLSTLGTSRHWVAHRFYQQHGYLDLANFASALANHDTLPEDTGVQLTVSRVVREDLPQADKLSRQVAIGKTGFSRRQEGFVEMMIEVGDILSIDQLRLICRDQDLVGYAAVRESQSLLAINNFLLLDSVTVVDAAAALLRTVTAPYIRIVTNSHSAYGEELRQAGFRVTNSTLDVMMIKSLQETKTRDQLQQLFDVASGRFMMSGYDVT